MRISQLRSVEKQLSKFVETFKDVLGGYSRKKYCLEYLYGLLLVGERKSIVPMVSRTHSNDAEAIQQFVADSPWEYESLQIALVDFMRRSLKLKAFRSILILDDTSFPKQGKASVGVAHQYCGALGKVSNCQVMVSWHYAEGGARQLHLPLISQLYLPKEWTKDQKRLEKAKVPNLKRKFAEKWRIALSLLDQIAENVPHEVCIFDAGYGRFREFFAELDKRDEYFIAQIPEIHGFWPSNVSIRSEQPNTGRPRQYAEVITPGISCLTAKQWYGKLSRRRKNWRSIHLPDQRKKEVRVAALRVREKIRRTHRGVGPERWLLIEEHPDGKIKYYISSLPKNTPLRRMIHLVHGRYKVEQGYQHLKEELGLDHYRGRSWNGFHHHVTLCFMAYDFLVLLQKKRFTKKNQRSKFSHISLPAVRRELNSLLQIVICPYCKHAFAFHPILPRI